MKTVLLVQYFEHLEMLLILHMRLFVMSCSSGGMSLGDIEVN